MLYRYGQYEGQPFQGPDDLFPSPKIAQFILQYGQKAMDAMEQLDGDEEKQYVEQMIAAGLLERDEATGELRLTPRMVRALEHRSLLEVFAHLRRGHKDGHATLDPGRGEERTDGSKVYEFGDPVSELDLGATMRNALRRAVRGDGRAELPLRVTPWDFEIHQTEGRADVAMCMLLDQSGSMMRYGRFFHAKRVALGMKALMRRRFAQDTLDFVGFYSTAEPLRESELPLVMPKPISVHDFSVRLRVPLEQAMSNPRSVPQHFTNLQLGLRLARRTLARRGAANKVIFIITDGQPTAHVEPGKAGETLHLIYPPSDRTAQATLREALLCQQQGIRIATFALAEDYHGLEWIGFVDRMTRLTRGVAYYCAGDDLASTIVESYLTGKKRKSFTA